MEYGLEIAIKDIVNGSDNYTNWTRQLKAYVNKIMTKDISHTGNVVSKSQEVVWMDCFKFIADYLASLSAEKQKYELVFEYSLPGTVHERPDICLLTDHKVIIMEFKKKEAPQMDANKDDVAQALRYKEWVQNHHKVTIDRKMEVVSYLVCTHENAIAGNLRGVEVLTKDNYGEVIAQELTGETLCSFRDEWLNSPKTEMPDMLQAIEIMYREGKIPYISDVNKKCLQAVLNHIDDAKSHHKKMLILVNGVPGAGKTAVGQSVVYEENKNGKANAVYLSGNGPLVKVLRYQIDQIENKHMAENAIQGMMEFKSSYFYTSYRVPEQSILVFDEAQRAWDAAKLKKDFTEPEGLFRVGERIFNKRGYVVLIVLFGNGQFIYKGEEAGLSLWEDALKAHSDWSVIVSEELADQLHGLGSRKIVDNSVYLPVSLRAGFIDCSKWVEQAICRADNSLQQAKEELKKLQKTSLRICVTRDFDKVKSRTAEIATNHPDWKYGILISNFAEQRIVEQAGPKWVTRDCKVSKNNCNPRFAGKCIDYNVSKDDYGPWFAGNCKELTTACSVYGCQGLELDCPIILLGGDYVRQNGRWIARGSRYNYDKRNGNYKDPDTIVENNFRVLLTRARKEMILLIPRDTSLDETYQYFLDMGMDEL